MSSALSLVLLFFLSAFPLRSRLHAASWSWVPAPAETAILDVRSEEIRPFPWVPKSSCEKPREPGCFKVEKVAPEKVVLRFERFDVEAGKLIPARFGYRTPVTKQGTEYELFALKPGGIEEEWVYAVLEKSSTHAATIRFLKYPAFVTDKARIAVAIELDLPGGRVRETHLIDAREPITLIGLSGLPSSLAPRSKIESVRVDREPISFPYEKIMNLNLPPGVHTVTADVALGIQTRKLTLQGTAFEPRKMQLIDELQLRALLSPQSTSAFLEVATIGLPNSVWDNFRGKIAVEPMPVSSTAQGLSVLYRFFPTRELKLKTRPRIPHEKRSYPLMIEVGIESTR